MNCQLLKRQISDRITVVNDVMGLRNDFNIDYMEHEIDMGGKFHRVTFKLTNYYSKFIVPNAELKLNTYIPDINVPSLTLYENYTVSTTDYNTITNIGYRGQTFTPTTSHNLKNVKLLLNKVGSPSGNTIISIRNTVSGQPDNIDLCTASIINNSLPVASDGEIWTTVSLEPVIGLVASTQYAILAKSLDVPSACARWNWIFKDLYPRGKYWQFISTTSVWATVSADFSFQEYGYPIP
jgi:hypothetical protein